MTSNAENILQHFIDTSVLDNVSTEQLKQIIEEQPYYGPAYFLLAKKLYQSKESGYEEVLHKAALHFPNPLWLNFILNDDDEVTEIEPKTSLSTHEEIEVEQIYPEPETLIPDNEETSLSEEVLPIEIDSRQEAEEIDTHEETEPVKEDSEVHDAVSERLSSILQEQAAAFEKPVEATTEIPLENIAYHRVDYFDSQGIKLEEEKPDDQLAKKLKKFTDWLKQMKRVNPNTVDLATDEAGEKQVQTSAEHSNENEEVLTETMAEVLIKQGKPEQAIQIYEKLSFNNPAKSAYFAAKIEELKG